MKHLFLLTALLVCLASPTLWGQAASPPTAKLVVLGHAGAGFFTPINPFNFRPPSSWRGVQYALRLGADGVEVDLQLSQDSVPVLYHDQKLEDMSTGRGCVSQFSAAQLVQLRYRGGWPYDWLQRERIVTFDTLLARLARRSTFPRLHLDLHESDPCRPAGPARDRMPALLRQLALSLRRYGVPFERVLLVSQEVSTLRLARALLPGLPTGLEITSDDVAAGLRLAQAEQARTVVLSASRITPALTARAHAAGLAVVGFGGRSAKGLKRILAAQPDELEADNVKRLLILQGRRK